MQSLGLFAKHLSHTLKGVAASIGAMTLFEVCQQLDRAFNEQNEANYSLLVDKTAKELTLVLSGIKQTMAAKL